MAAWHERPASLLFGNWVFDKGSTLVKARFSQHHARKARIEIRKSPTLSLSLSLSLSGARAVETHALEVYGARVAYERSPKCRLLCQVSDRPLTRTHHVALSQNSRTSLERKRPLRGPQLSFSLDSLRDAGPSNAPKWGCGLARLRSGDLQRNRKRRRRPLQREREIGLLGVLRAVRFVTI